MSVNKNVLGLTVTLLICCFGSISGQDEYHQNLQSELMSEYDLPEAEFIISDTEESVQSAAYNWGSTKQDGLIDNQPFSRSTIVTVNQAGSNSWDAGYFALNTTTVTQGDKLLWIFNVRSTGGSDGEASIIIEETQSGNYQKEVFIPATFGQEWTRYLVATEVSLGNRPAGGLQIGFHLGQVAQTLEFGGFTVLNYGNQVELSDLPSTLDAGSYDGSAADAPWRAPAADRIETLRKADLTILTTDQNGTNVAGVDLDVKMIQHEFAFGTAIKGCRFPGNDCSNAQYRDNLLNLDGNGHGFNYVVYENDLKWNAWEELWFGSNEEIASSVEYLVDRGIKVRGHVLVWPGWNNLPADMQANATNEPYLIERTQNHLETILNYPGIDGNLIDWDVINETVANTDLAAALAGEPGYQTGREFYAEIFEMAREHAPEAKLYFNDYSTITLGQEAGDNSYETLRSHLEELVALDAPMDGIGFQGHVGAFPNGIPSVLGIFDDFYDQFGLEQKVTEFDMPPNVSEELGADYLSDFLTATFSHESMTGFLLWNFWDVDTWMNPGSNLFDADWNRTPAGDAFVDKVFNEWWTEASLESNTDGQADLRGFKGQYAITYGCGGTTVTDTINLTEDQVISIECDDFVISNLDTEIEQTNFALGPNPNNGSFRINHSFGAQTKATVTDALGRRVWRGELRNQVNDLHLDLIPGTYFVELSNGSVKANRKMIVW